MLGISVEDKFIGLFKAVLVNPGLDMAVDGGDVLHPQVHGAALEPDLGQGLGVGRVGALCQRHNFT